MGILIEMRGKVISELPFGQFETLVQQKLDEPNVNFVMIFLIIFELRLCILTINVFLRIHVSQGFPHGDLAL